MAVGTELYTSYIAVRGGEKRSRPDAKELF